MIWLMLIAAWLGGVTMALVIRWWDRRGERREYAWELAGPGGGRLLITTGYDAGWIMRLVSEQGYTIVRRP